MKCTLLSQFDSALFSPHFYWGSMTKAHTRDSNSVVVVEACTNLANPIWSPVSTNALNAFFGTNGMSYLSDPQRANYPGRFYRIRSQ
jgi:hypothetical protein